MPDLEVRKDGRAGRITLNRPKALNALTWDMCTAIEAALDAWQDDPDVALVLIDGAGERAFCAGGDIAEMYAAGLRGDLDYGRRFWRDEYRMNARIAHYPKPVVSFLHGFTMGGGVGVGCHAAHRIVCETSQIALPECSIGLVPDVGGTLLLAKAPGQCGTYLGLSGARMDAGDALYTGFADVFIPQTHWDNAKRALTRDADLAVLDALAAPPPKTRLRDWQPEIDTCFDARTLGALEDAITGADGPALRHIRKKLDHNAPLAMACALANIAAVRRDPRIETALEHEFRFTFRCVEQGDFIEGIRAAIIDRDHTPLWQHQTWADVPASQVAAMTAGLGDKALLLKG